MNEPIVIREIVVNGRTLRAEPPIEVNYLCISSGTGLGPYFYWECEFGKASHSDFDQFVKCCHAIASIVTGKQIGRAHV